MKILYRNLRHGVIKVRIENLDDLWYLSSVVKKGDVVRGKTERRIEAKSDITRSGKSERRTVSMEIRVEKTDFRSDADTLRIAGTIEQGPEDIVSVGSHHTFNITEGTTISIKKGRWFNEEIERLKEAERATLRPKILIAVIDEGEANIGLVRESKVKYYSLSKAIGGKYDTKGRGGRKTEFYRDTEKFILDTLKRENISSVIIAGAGFEKDNFHSFLKERNQEVCKMVILEGIGSYGVNGIKEVMSRPVMQKISEEINAAREIRLINRALAEIGKDSGLCIYSMGDSENAADIGAIETLIVCDDLFLKERGRVERIMNTVRSRKGNVHLINHEGEAGQQLNALGGIAAILRFKV